MILQLSDVAGVLEGAPPAEDVAVTGWSVDTRTLQRGDVFFALRGPNHDGHDHVPLAFEKGAVAVVAEHPMSGGRVIVVADVLAALQRLAEWARGHWGGKIVGVTGSAGKTTTKDAIAHVLASAMPVGKTAGNLNNHVGVPLSLLRLEDGARVGVLELGMNHANEIRVLASIAKPEIGVVTNVGYAHVENFESIDGVALAKRELIESLDPEHGIAVLNGDDPRVLRFRKIHRGRSITFGMSTECDVYAEDVSCGPDGAHFSVDGIEFYSSLSGEHSVRNLLAALAVARAFDLPLRGLRKAVGNFTVGKMRGERLTKNGIIVWNDCYNSNPEACRAMIDVLRATSARHRFAVLGEMLELGSASEFLHRQVGRYAVENGLDGLIGVRGAARYMIEEAQRAGMSPQAARFFEEPSEAGVYISQAAIAGDAILFKGSRGVAIERAMEKVLA